MQKMRSRKPKGPLHHDPKAVTRARESAGLTKTALAKEIGKALSVVSEIESGTRNATPATLRAIAKATNFPVSMLERKRAS